MRKMCVVPKAMIDDWLLAKKCRVPPGAEKRLELACYIAAFRKPCGYPAAALIARLLPNGDVEVNTPSRLRARVAEVPTSVELAGVNTWSIGFLLELIVVVLVAHLVWAVCDTILRS